MALRFDDSRVENVNYKELYHSALADPSAIDGDTLSTLIDRFPYAQALRIAQARKNQQENGSMDEESAFFITSLPHWLYGYVAIETLPTKYAIRPNDEVAATDEIAETDEVATPDEASTETDAMRSDIETVIPDMDDSGLIEHPVGMDYFAYEKSAVVGADDSPAEVSQEMVPLAEATPHEKVSLYNDDHLPYSFLWWLNKTRMEYAHAYRPYAPPADYPADAADVPDDERVLDQQIRENIFHLQSPEEKLSTGRPPETVSFHIPKKTDPIIERFIREEPQIKPPQADKINLENKARKSAEDQLSLVTETLANIYVEQGLYPKAIAIYKKLSLKYPEKSTYFAARITELTNRLP